MTRRAGSRSKSERTPFLTCTALREQVQSVATTDRKAAAKALGVPVWRLRRPLASKITVSEAPPPAPPAPPPVKAKPAPVAQKAPKSNAYKASWTKERRLAQGARMAQMWVDRRAKIETEPQVEQVAQVLPAQPEVIAEAPQEPVLPVPPRERRARLTAEQKLAQTERDVDAALPAVQEVLRRWPFSTPARLEEETGVPRTIVVLVLDKLGIPRKRHERAGW